MGRRKYKGRRVSEAKHLRPAHRPWEFSKKLALWSIVIGTLALVASVVLSFMDKQPLTDLTSTIFTACIGYLITYPAKSATEKISRNRHGIDADGNPITNSEPPDDTGGSEI